MEPQLRFNINRMVDWVEPTAVEKASYQADEKLIYQRMANLRLVWRISKDLNLQDRELIGKEWELAFANLWVVAVKRFRSFLPLHSVPYPQEFHVTLEEEEILAKEELDKAAFHWDTESLGNFTPVDQMTKDLLVQTWVEHYVRLGELGLHRYYREPLTWTGPKLRELTPRDMIRWAQEDAIRRVNRRVLNKYRKGKYVPKIAPEKH